MEARIFVAMQLPLYGALSKIDCLALKIDQAKGKMTKYHQPLVENTILHMGRTTNAGLNVIDQVAQGEAFASITDNERRMEDEQLENQEDPIPRSEIRLKWATVHRRL